MSDNGTKTPAVPAVPTTDKDFGQIERAIDMHLKQPVSASRFLKELLRNLNQSLTRISKLEQEMATLKASSAPPKKPKPEDSLNNV